MTLRAAQSLRDILRPVADRAVDGARRTQHWHIVDLDRFQFPVVIDMAPRLIDLARRAGSAEACGGHAERTKDLALDRPFPRFAGLRFDYRSEPDVADVGVRKFSDRCHRRR